MKAHLYDGKEELFKVVEIPDNPTPPKIVVRENRAFGLKQFGNVAKYSEITVFFSPSESDKLDSFFDNLFVGQWVESVIGEIGRVKAWSKTDKRVWVVFHCAMEWDKFADYTGIGCDWDQIKKIEDPRLSKVSDTSEINRDEELKKALASVMRDHVSLHPRAKVLSSDLVWNWVESKFEPPSEIVVGREAYHFVMVIRKRFLDESGKTVRRLLDDSDASDTCEHHYLPDGGKWSPQGQKKCQNCGDVIGD